MPSAIPSFIAVRGTVAEDCSEPKLTVAGTVASDVSLLERLTSRLSKKPVLRVIVTVAVPPFSEMLAGATETLRVATSSSVTSTVSVASAGNKSPEAVMVTVWVPSTSASSMAVRVTVVVVSPGLKVAVAGTVASDIVIAGEVDGESLVGVGVAGKGDVGGAAIFRNARC